MDFISVSKTGSMLVKSAFGKDIAIMETVNNIMIGYRKYPNLAIESIS